MALPFECIDSLGRDLYNEDGSPQYQILLFGSTETGDSICVQVEGYHPSFLIELPKGCSIRPAVTAFKNWILDAMEGSTGITFTHERHKTLWDYNLEAYSDFIKIECVSLKGWRKCKELLLDDHSLPLELPTFRVLGSDGVSVAGPRCKMQVYEANLDPLLRFFHERDLAPASWMQVTDWEEAETKEANTKLFVSCDWKSVSVLPPTSPLLKIHAPLLICAWDIECTSAHGDFPLPKKTWRKQAREALEKKLKTYPALCSAIAEAFVGTKGSLLSSVHLRDKGARPLVTAKDVELALDGRKSAIVSALRSESLEEGTDALDTALTASLPAIAGDPIIQIGMVLYRNGVPVRKHIWVLGGCDREAVKPPGLEVPIEVYVFHDETALLRAWCRWMSDNDPDVLVGYNVFGFDETFVWDRAKELHIESALAPWSRLGTTKPALEKKELSSAAMGDNTMYMLKSIGRLQVDMLHYVRKNYPLDSYTLDNVSATFVSGAVVGALKEEGKKTFRFGTKSTKGTVVGRYITLLDEENDRVVDRCIVVGVEPKALVVEITGGQATLDEHGAAPVRWAQVKDDISPQQIFASQRGSDKDRALIAKYCLQDCDLVMELFQKLDVLNNAIAMANVCSVPVGFIFTRGQGVKIESLIFKEARKEDKLICGLSVTPRDSVEELVDDPSYEGAIVLDPKTGIYIDDPVTVLDFASLYPSTIISENISHDTLIWVKEYDLKGDFVKLVEGSDTFDNLVGASYVNIDFDLLVPDPSSSLKHPPKVKLGTRIARYIQVPVKGRDSIGNEGTIPKILKMLLSSRKAARKEAEKETDEFRKALLDAKQLAYKLTANSLYGQLGSGTFKVRRQVLAASTTAYGRKQLLFAKECIETVYGVDTTAVGCKTAGKDPRCCAEYVYGDSVTGDTPLLLKEGEHAPFLKRIDELEGEWTPYHETKEAMNINLNVWTELGFTKIHRVIRHKLDPIKKIFRILTHTGVADVTEDHSLVLSNKEKIKPSDVKVGTELLHEYTSHLSLESNATDITVNEAFVMGLFVADGSSDVYKCPSGSKGTWAINKADMKLLTLAQTKCPFPTKILDTIESSGVYKLVPVGSIVGPARKYRSLFYNKYREKRIPSIILNSPIEIVQSFWDGFYAGDGDKDPKGFTRIDQKGKEISMGLYLLARRLEYNVSLTDRIDKQNVFRITMTKKKQRKNPIAIKKIRELPHPGDAFVYDLETTNHHFGVGPGALIVHNTDSVFMKFNPKNPVTGERLHGMEALVAAKAITEEAGHLVSGCLKAPHDFEFDKMFRTFCLLSKKRYVGDMTEGDLDDFHRKAMGIVMKRRDNAPIVKYVYGGVIDRILDPSLTDSTEGVKSAFAFVQETTRNLLQGKVPMSKLTITKSLRSEYADPTRIAHKVLADRMAERDPGNAPSTTERIPFVYILPEPGMTPSKLQGDRIELPSYIREKKLKIDYPHYITNQIAKPIAQVFGLEVEKLPGVTRSAIIATSKAKDPVAAREALAQSLLFDKLLLEASRTPETMERKGQTSITKFLKPTS
jgi:DNA polymerase elongation subunit (family B)